MTNAMQQLDVDRVRHAVHHVRPARRRALQHRGAWRRRKRKPGFDRSFEARAQIASHQKDLHSGVEGGGIDEPMQDMCVSFPWWPRDESRWVADARARRVQLLSTLMGRDRTVLVPGFCACLTNPPRLRAELTSVCAARGQTTACARRTRRRGSCSSASRRSRRRPRRRSRRAGASRRSRSITSRGPARAVSLSAGAQVRR